jgi:hypothetical protein
MSNVQMPELVFVFVAAGGLGVALVFAAMVLASARAASSHLAAGLALTAPGASSNAGTPKRFDYPAPGAVSRDERQSNLGLTAGSGPPDAADPQQIVAQLNQYYAANISQGNAIFWASLLSMSIGFAIVFVGIVTAGPNSTTAIVAGVAGVLSQFIAATFLVALRSTQQQSTTYAQTLVELRLRDVRAAAEARSVALGLRLLDEIAGDGADALANQTRATLAMGLIVKDAGPLTPGAPVVPTPVNDDHTPRAPFRAAPARAEAVKFDTTRAGSERTARDPK